MIVSQVTFSHYFSEKNTKFFAEEVYFAIVTAG